MLWQEFSPLTRETRIEPEKALQFGFGVAAAPMWAAYMAVAGAGVSYWMMTSWTRRAGLAVEPRSFAPEPVTPALEAVVAVETAAAAPLAFEAPAVIEPAMPEAAPVETAPLEAAPVEAAPVLEAAPLEAEPAVDLASVMDEAPLAEASPVVAAPVAMTASRPTPAMKPARRKPAPKLTA